MTRSYQGLPVREGPTANITAHAPGEFFTTPVPRLRLRTMSLGRPQRSPWRFHVQPRLQATGLGSVALSLAWERMSGPWWLRPAG